MRELIDLLHVLSPAERRRFGFILFGMIVAAIVDAAGVATIMPFLVLVANSGSATVLGALEKLRAALGIADRNQFVVVVGLLSLAAIVFSSAINAIVTWAQVRFCNMAGCTISRRLLDAYLAQSQLAILNRNSVEMGKNILSEVDRLVAGAFTPALTLIARTAAAVCIVVLLMVVEPLLAMLLAVVFGGVYVVLYLAVSRWMARIGTASMAGNELRFKVVTEAFAALRELRLYGRVHDFIRHFDAPAQAYARANSTSLVIGQTPKFILEPMAFVAVIVMVFYTMRSGGDLQSVLPLVGLFTFAGYRLIPSFQNIFMAVSTVRYYLPAIQVIARDLKAASAQPSDEAAVAPAPSGDITLRNVSFGYREEAAILDRIDLSIKACSTVGLIGRTGSGKTTLVSLLVGLLPPTSGEISVGGRPISGATLTAWQRRIGYVPQEVFLTDDTIEANIALGVPAEKIDRAAVERAARLAHVHDFIMTLPEQYRTRAGERGSHLSGGQRQRIGIARALYHDPDVIVFDEATSALDAETEQAVLAALDDLAGQRTLIIISHRGAALRRADVVHVIDRGRIAASGPAERFIAAMDGEDAAPHSAAGST